ncbi:MAG: hypothetical protein GXO87_06420, partial [Chlorobi bacterium]|nr:hypothetical protein [Chlorobiota bacterium]
MIKKNIPLIIILFVDAVILFICAAGIYHISQKAALPFKLEKKNNKLVVIGREGKLNSIAEKETLTGVAGYNVKDVEEIECITDAIPIGGKVAVVLKNKNTEIEVRLKTVPFYRSAYLIIASFVSLFFLLTGIFVLVKRPDLKSARLFHAGCVSTAVIIATTWGNYAIEPYELGKFLRIVFSAAYSFVPFFFILFVLSLRDSKPKRYLIIKIMLISVSTVIFILQSVSFLNFVDLKTIESLRLYLHIF